MNQNSTKIWGSVTTPELNENDLQYFCSMIEERAGIFLKPAKHDLVRTRLRNRIIANGFNTFTEYRRHLNSLAASDPEWETFTNLLTTNKTDFFREPQHFLFLVEKILPMWLKSGHKTFNVWSAASSTGEEPYTLAMVLDHHLPQGVDFRILATDINTEVLKTARNAVYSAAKRPEIPVEHQQQSIDIGDGDARGWFRIKPHIKEKVVFKLHNLIEREVPAENTFDLVLCRNVLIYFGHDTINFVQRKLHSTVKEGGHLFIGHSESLQGMHHAWQPVGPSIFRKSS